MLLAIDAGNTNIKFALIDGQDIRTRWRIATDPRRTGDQYAVWLTQLLELEGFARSDVDAVAIATVVPRALHNLEVLSSKYFAVTPYVAGRGTKGWGIALEVEESRSVGADRACNAIGAHELVAGEKIVISFGTATTVDYVDGKGAYRGGIIAPGINLSLDALVAAAAMLPRIAIEAPANNHVIGRTTQSQMHIGIYWGYVSMIEGLIARMKEEIGVPVKVVATGGLAVLFEEQTHLFDHIEPNLTLRGLASLYRSQGASV